MRKIILCTVLTFSLLAGSLATASAAFYNTEDAPGAAFGTPTSVEPSVTAEEDNNINRSKDSAFVPPAFGSPTSNTQGTGNSLTPNISGAATMQISTATVSGTGTVTYPDGGTYYSNDDTVTVFIPPPAEPGTSSPPSSAFTLPDGLFYSDGSLGTLSISKLGLKVKVYEDESLESLAKGAGHFKFTSVWNGNVGLAGHNRGVANHFGQIHTLQNGDKITYTTMLGTRTYEVFFVGKVNETDFSRLDRTTDNIISLFTCVRDVPSLRWCVQAREN